MIAQHQKMCGPRKLTPWSLTSRLKTLTSVWTVWQDDILFFFLTFLFKYPLWKCRLITRSKTNYLENFLIPKEALTYDHQLVPEAKWNKTSYSRVAKLHAWLIYCSSGMEFFNYYLEKKMCRKCLHWRWTSKTGGNFTSVSDKSLFYTKGKEIQKKGVSISYSSHGLSTTLGLEEVNILLATTHSPFQRT